MKEKRGVVVVVRGGGGGHKSNLAPRFGRRVLRLISAPSSSASSNGGNPRLSARRKQGKAKLG